ncbi:MAG: hypothetical protein JRC92_01560, partial [Deltaproteobacteria bacterium]|nr:hypothetical protein [Deltaproteobacteria bacterium]
VSMVELYEAVFGVRVRDKINDTRRLRKYINALQREGRPICSVTTQDGAGYYLASAESDLNDYLLRQRKRGLRILAKEAKMRRVSLPALLGQIQLNLRPQEVEP